MKKLILLLATAIICLNLTAQEVPEKKDEKKEPLKKEKPLKVDMSFEELLKLAATTPPAHKQSKKKKKD